MAKKYLLGFMIFVVLTASFYILIPDSLRIDVEKTKTTFKVWEDEWVLAGTERTILYDGTKKMRASSREINYFIEDNKTKIVRTANFKEGIIAIDTYYFDGDTDDIELYPIEHTVEIINGKGKLFVYEVNDLEYFGETKKDIPSPQIFGHRMKVEWQDGNYYSKIFKYKNKDIGKLTVKYRVYENYETYSVRLFDPVYSSGTITYDGDYTIHTFTTNGTFNVTRTGNIEEILIIAGGGAGGGQITDGGGGGGAGGLVYNTENLSINPGDYLIYVGIGGIGVSDIVIGENGTDSSALGLVAIGGGGGGKGGGGIGADGGSAGGAGFNGVGGDSIQTSFPNATGFGNDGGDGSTSTGGGGGADGEGASGGAQDGGDGGTGKTYDINGTSTCYAGGGGGGEAQGSVGTTSCGGGLAVVNAGGEDGIDGTGGGGGGGSYATGDANSGGDGGNGVVIIRYLTLEFSQPTVTLETPSNYTNFTTNEVGFECYVYDEDYDLVNVSLYIDDVLNETIETPANATIQTFNKTLSEGEHWWTCKVCSNISECFTAEKFLLNVDTIIPIPNIDYPVNDSYIINVSDLNYTIIETNPSYCWYSNNSGETNSSTQTCMDNWTDVYSIEGQNTWIVYVNDTLGNENQTNVTFNKDTAVPLISFESETEVNGSAKNNTFIYANVSVTEANEQNITYELYWQNGTLANSSTYTTSRREINWTGFSYGTYLYNVTVFDTLSQSNYTETRTIYLSDVFLFIDLNEIDLHIELNTTVNITGNSSTDFGLICLDIDHPDYGDNYTCSSGSVTTNLTFDYFQKTSFWDRIVSKIFTFTVDVPVDDENLTIESHQYDEVDDLRFNISSSDDAENVVFYKCNTTTIDRAYNGFLVGKNIYLNQSINAAEDTFRNYENISFDNPGNATVYFYLDDNANIQNITMNVTGKEYGFSYFDDFTDFSNIDVSETTAQLHYGPGGFIQSPNSSLSFRTFDNFNDASIANHWTYDASASGTGYAWGVRETSGYLEAYAGIENGYDGSATRGFYPNYTNLWFYTSDYLSFDINGYYYGLEDSGGGCSGSNIVKFAGVNAYASSHINSVSDNEESLIDLSFEMTKVNNSYWEVNISGTEIQTTVFATDCDDTGNVVRIYNYTNGSIDTDWADPDCIDTSTPLSNSSFMFVDETKVIVEFSLSISDSAACSGTDNYIRLDNLKNKMWNRTNGTVMSNSVFDASSNIVSSTLNVSGYGGGNYSTFLWLSADNGDHWESVTHGVEHNFIYPGKHVKWKVDFNTTTPGYHNATLYLVNVTVETPVSSVSDLEFDFGNDGIWDYKLNGTFDENNESLIISMPDADISNAFTKRRVTTIGGISYDHAYHIPMRIYSATAGQIDLDIFNIIYDPNPVILNYSSIQTFLDTYGSNETNFTIPIGGINGSVNVSDIKLDYAGGNSTIAITIRNLLNTINLTRYITAYYSGFYKNLPYTWTEHIFFLPRTNSSKNVTAYGQTTTKPLFNFTTTNYGARTENISIRLDQNDSCIDLKWNSSSTIPSYGVNTIGTTWQEIITESQYLGNANIWVWADLTNCNASESRMLSPTFEFESYCENCTWVGS